MHRFARPLVRPGLVALLTLGLLAAAATPARADMALLPGLQPAPGIGRQLLQRRFDRLIQVTSASPEQRAQLWAICDRLLTTIARNRRDVRQLRQTFRQLFTAEQLDLGRLAQVRAQQEAHSRVIGDAMLQALREVHALLTPAQRLAVAQSIGGRARRPRLNGGIISLPRGAATAPAASIAPPPATPAPAAPAPAAPAPAAPAPAPAAP